MADHDEWGSAAEEAAFAERALAQGDLPHAFQHLANALLDTVGEDTFLDLLRRVIEPAEELSTLVDPQAGADRLVSARAVALHLRGRDDEALPLLAEVAAYRADLPYHRWLGPWIAGTQASLAAHDYFSYLLVPSRATVGRIALRPAEVRFAAEVATVVDSLLDRTDTGSHHALLALASGVYRRAARYDDAIGAARRSLASEESYFGHTMLGLAARAHRDFGLAREAFENALRCDPDSALPINADLGRVAWEAGDLEEARERFARLRRDAPDDTEA